MNVYSVLVALVAVLLPCRTVSIRGGDEGDALNEAVSRILKQKVDRAKADEINGAPTDCSTYHYVVEVTDDLTMTYVVEPTDVVGAALSVQLEYGGAAWIALGFSKDSKGKLKGSDMIIGIPDEPMSVSNPGKYHLTTDEITRTSVVDAESQTLTDGTISQIDGRTIMTFTKTLEEDGDIELKSEGDFTFVWAIGIDNTLGFEDETLLSGSFKLEMMPCIPQTEDDLVLTVASTGNGADYTLEAGANLPIIPIDCASDYQSTIILMKGLMLSYSVRVGASEDQEDTISIMMEYEGEAWLAFGTANALGSKMMVGGEAIIGLPDEPESLINPGKYHLIGESRMGVFPMDVLQQTLSNARISQTTGKTVLTYKKKLREVGEIGIGGAGLNTFIWAVGSSNDLNLHRHSGHVRLEVAPCLGNFPAPSQGAESLETRSGLSFERRRQMWLAHAICGVFAWAVLAPAAVGTAWFRQMFKSRRSLWFRIHMYFNIAALALTMIGFALAVSLYNDSGDEHFVGSHQAVGLTIFFIVGLQSFAGLFRPSTSPAINDVRRIGFTDSFSAIGSIGKETSRPSWAQQVDESSHNEPDRRTMIRAGWNVGHRLVGLYLVILGLWQVQSGIQLYAEKYEENDYSGTFWAYIVVLAILLICISIYSKTREMQLDHDAEASREPLRQRRVVEIVMSRHQSFPTDSSIEDSFRDEESEITTIDEKPVVCRSRSLVRGDAMDLMGFCRNEPAQAQACRSLDGSLYIEESSAYSGGQGMHTTQEWGARDDFSEVLKECELAKDDGIVPDSSARAVNTDNRDDIVSEIVDLTENRNENAAVL